MVNVLTSANAGFVLAIAGVVALINADGLARLDAHLPSPLCDFAEEQLSRRLVEISSVGVIGIGAVLLFIGLTAS